MLLNAPVLVSVRVWLLLPLNPISLDMASSLGLNAQLMRLSGGVVRSPCVQAASKSVMTLIKRRLRAVVAVRFGLNIRSHPLI